MVRAFRSVDDNISISSSAQSMHSMRGGKYPSCMYVSSKNGSCENKNTKCLERIHSPNYGGYEPKFNRVKLKKNELNAVL